jgi:hypothetical protein
MIPNLSSLSSNTSRRCLPIGVTKSAFEADRASICEICHEPLNEDSPYAWAGGTDDEIDVRSVCENTHVFHMGCIKQMLTSTTREPLCPSCRSPIEANVQQAIKIEKYQQSANDMPNPTEEFKVLSTTMLTWLARAIGKEGLPPLTIEEMETAWEDEPFAKYRKHLAFLSEYADSFESIWNLLTDVVDGLPYPASRVDEYRKWTEDVVDMPLVDMPRNAELLKTTARTLRALLTRAKKHADSPLKREDVSQIWNDEPIVTFRKKMRDLQDQYKWVQGAVEQVFDLCFTEEDN